MTRNKVTRWQCLRYTFPTLQTNPPDACCDWSQ